MPFPVYRYAKIKKEVLSDFLFKSGAGEESRTLDLNLGKVALYQLSYSRFVVVCCDVVATGRHYRDSVQYVKDATKQIKPVPTCP